MRLNGKFLCSNFNKIKVILNFNFHDIIYKKEVNMKKFLMILSLIVFFIGAANAEVILAPQWSEFCPVSYMSAKASKWNTDNNYWYERRVQFENSLNQCQSYKDNDLKSCYSQIREAELNKNKAWNAKIEVRNKEHEEYIDYRNKQQTIDAVNSVIRTIKW